MKKLLVFFVTLLGLVSFMNCSPKTTGAVATQQPKETTEVKPSYAIAEMDEGKRIWGTSCDKCHKLYEPKSRSQTAWEKILPEMGRKAKLDDKQVAMVRVYILSQI